MSPAVVPRYLSIRSRPAHLPRIAYDSRQHKCLAHTITHNACTDRSEMLSEQLAAAMIIGYLSGSIPFAWLAARAVVVDFNLVAA